MHKKSIGLYAVLLSLILLSCFPATALAYFDPGTGSMLLQLLGVAFIALGGFFIAFKNRIRSFFRKKKGLPEDDDDTDDEDVPVQTTGTPAGDATKTEDGKGHAGE